MTSDRDNSVLQLAGFTTPTIANAIETFGVRARDEGFMDHSIGCRFPSLGPLVGYAATARIRAKGAGPSERPAELWRHVASLPAPRVVVIEDLDEPPGVGSFWGEVNANVYRALGCAGVVTNGCVRDLTEMATLGFQAFSSCICVSHAYVRLVEVGQPVRVGGLEVRPGDLLHGDRHGVLKVPPGIVAELAEAARGVEAAERKLIAFCQSPGFSLEGLDAFELE